MWNFQLRSQSKHRWQHEYDDLQPCPWNVNIWSPDVNWGLWPSWLNPDHKHDIELTWNGVDTQGKCWNWKIVTLAHLSKPLKWQSRLKSCACFRKGVSASNAIILWLKSRSLSDEKANRQHWGYVGRTNSDKKPKTKTMRRVLRTPPPPLDFQEAECNKFIITPRKNSRILF